MRIDPVGRKSLQGADRDWAVELRTVAVLFTRMIANPTNSSRKGIVLLDHMEGFLVAAGLDQGDITLSAGLGRAGMLTRARPPLCHEKGIWDSLRIRNINRFPLIEASVKFIRKYHRANLCAVVAARAFLNVHVPGPSPNFSLKISGFSFERKKVGIRDNLDIQMPPRLDQLRRKDTHRTIVGGKGFVELRHDPTDGSGRFQ
jgi:hypothetical protein